MSNNQANQVKAAQLFRDAAYGGDLEAQFEFGICLRDGVGVQQNPQEAIEWFRKAAEAGHTGAAQALSMLQRPVPPAPQTPPATPPPTNLPTTETAAHYNGIAFAVFVGIAAFIIFCCVCQDTVGGGLFSEPENDAG